MTETCRNKSSKSQDIHHGWCYFKEEEPIQCSPKISSQSFYDAFTAFLSSSRTVDVEDNNVNESLCPNVELRKLELEDDEVDLKRQLTSDTGRNKEKLGRVIEDCASAETCVTDVCLAGDMSSIEKECTEPTVSRTFADANMSHDLSACKEYKNEYPPSISSGKGLRNLRSRDSYGKCDQNDGKSSAPTFLRRSTVEVNCQQDLSCDGEKPVERDSFSSPYQQLQRFSSAGNFSRPCNSESQFLKSRNFKRVNNNGNNEPINSECQFQYKEEYRRKLRSARDAVERCAVSELCRTQSAQQSRLSTLRRRNSLSSNGHVLLYDCFSTHRTQKALCRPVFVLLEKMSRKKIKELQVEMKMCANVRDVTKTSGSRETDVLKSADDLVQNYDFVNSSAGAQGDDVSKISPSSTTDKNEDEPSCCTNTEEATSTLQSTRTGMNFEASQLCSDDTVKSKSETGMIADAPLNLDSSRILKNSDIRCSQSRISEVYENEPVLLVQEVSGKVLDVENTTQGLETSGSIHAPVLVEMKSGSVSKHKRVFKPEIEKICSSRAIDKSGFDLSLNEANNTGCMRTMFKAVDQHDFKPELDASNVCNSGSSIVVTESVEHSKVVGTRPPYFAVTPDTIELPKALTKSDIIQDKLKLNAVDILVNPSIDGSKGVSQTMDGLGVMTISLNTFNSSLLEPVKVKIRSRLTDSKAALNSNVQAQCIENSEYFSKCSGMDKRKKKRFSSSQNDVLGFNTLSSISEYPKDCLKSSVTASVQPTKARKRKAECQVAAFQKASVHQPDDEDSYVPNFMTHSQSLDESDLIEKWKEATDLEEWWLNDIGNWINLGAVSSTISSSTTSEKSMGSEDFRWCAMIADQSEWPELELDFPTRSEGSTDECNRRFPITTDAEHALCGEGANPSELDVNRCDDSQMLETHRSIARLNCVKQRTCRVGKKQQVQWLKLREAGSLNTCKLTTAAGKDIKITDSEPNDTFLGKGLSDNIGLEADDKTHDQVDRMMTTCISHTEALRAKSCDKNNADNGASSVPASVGTLPVTSSPAFVGSSSITSSPAFVGTSSITSSPALVGTPSGTSSPSLIGTSSGTSSPALLGKLSVTSAANPTHTYSVASVILSSSDVRMNPCDDTFSRTSSLLACCRSRSESLFSHTSSSLVSRSPSYLNLKCNAAIASVSHNQSTVAPFCQNHIGLHCDPNSGVASLGQNWCDSRFDFDPCVIPSSAYFVPCNRANSKSCFIQNASTASVTCTSSVSVASMSNCHEKLSRCQTIASEVKLNCAKQSQASAQCESRAKGITAERTLGSLTLSETATTNTVKHVIPVTCSTVDSSSLASDSAITTSNRVDTGLGLGCSSFLCQTEDDDSAKTEQSMVNNEVHQKRNFVYDDLKNSRLIPSSSKTEACEKNLAFDKNDWDHHSFLGSLAKSQFESPVLRIGLHMQGRSQERDEFCSKDLLKESQPCDSYAGLCGRFSKLDQGLICDSSEALDVVSENSSQEFPPEVNSKACAKGAGPLSHSSEDALMYNDCNSDMCSWLAASMGLYTCDCGAAFSDSWSCQQHQARCSAVIRT